jgi:cysteinyl-tRNA synthetase
MGVVQLCPEQIGNSELMAEGEGALSVGAQDKRDDADFALWKKQQPAKGESKASSG